MKIKEFSKKQLAALSWWHPNSVYSDMDAIICDGSVRSGKTLCMGISFFLWSFSSFRDSNFAVCGKTITSIRRNLIVPLLPILRSNGFECAEKLSENKLTVRYRGRENRFYLFGGRDESSAALIQGMTLCGVLFDEAALMPRSFIEQALARCSVTGSKFWFNCNPEHPRHWFYLEWIKKAEKRRALHLHFTMDDNPSLTEKIKRRYENMYSGAFYRRFVKGEWAATEGAVYPFMDDEKMYKPVPKGEFSRYIISCDYGTVNPTSFGLWGKLGEVWYRIKEYYFDSRRQGFQRTDEEHYSELERLADGRKIDRVVIDPSAASFIEVVRRHGRFEAVSAENNVVNGIRKVSQALKDGSVVICDVCADSRREFSLYRWSGDGTSDKPIKENDHAMDDIRYFVSDITGRRNIFSVYAAER